MWFKPKRGLPDWEPATKHLSKASPALGKVIEQVGPCLLAPRRDYFIALCQAIFTQQVSTAVATVLFGRFRKLFPRGKPTPALVLKLTDEQLSSAGLSRQKKIYIRDLARHFADGEVPVRRFAAMDDEAIIESLIRVKGIGRWTGEMFLIFVLNRPDLLPVDDLGVKKGIQKLHRLKEMPTAQSMVKLTEKWRPWRSVGTWYLWRGLGNGVL